MTLGYYVDRETAGHRTKCVFIRTAQKNAGVKLRVAAKDRFEHLGLAQAVDEALDQDEKSISTRDRQ